MISSFLVFLLSVYPINAQANIEQSKDQDICKLLNDVDVVINQIEIIRGRNNDVIWNQTLAQQQYLKETILTSVPEVALCANTPTPTPTLTPVPRFRTNGYMVFNPERIAQAADGTFTVDIMVDPVNKPLKTVISNISFDDEAVSPVAVLPSSYTSLFSHEVLPGLLKLRGTSIQPVFGHGIVASVVFQKKKEGSTTLKFVCGTDNSNTSQLVMYTTSPIAINLLSCDYTNKLTVD